jgi:hypothetical protein
MGFGSWMAKPLKNISNAIFKRDFKFSCKLIITIIFSMSQIVGKKIKMSKNNPK